MNINFKTANPSEDIVDRISNILFDYHETTLLREKLQNADDAGATIVKVLYDKTTYPTTGLLFDSGKELQERESLLVYNNSIFQEKDWKGIMSLGSGSKREDIKSVGKFGLGFNSVYHITDYPMIVSGEKFVIHDILGNICPGGCEIDFVEFKLRDNYPNQCQPLLHFGCNMKSYFNGTLFRLPFRIGKSKIKEEPMNLDTFSRVLNEFIEQSQLLLLFMRNVAEIDIYDSNGPLFSVVISNAHEIKRQRKLVFDFISKVADEMTNYDMKSFIELMLKYKKELPVESYRMDLMIVDNRNGEMKQTKLSYAITNGFIADKLESIQVHNKAKFIPCGGIATPLFKTSDQFKSFESVPFAFLPIGDIRYKLPFHFNSSFILSNARTDIHFSKPTSELGTSDQKNSKWNEYILDTITPSLYVNNLNFIISNGLFNEENLYSHFPQYNALTRDKVVQDQSILKILKESVFLDIFTKKFYPISQCFVLNSDVHEDILNVLKERDVKVIILPNDLLKIIVSLKHPISYVRPELVCGVLKKKQLQQFNFNILKYLVLSKYDISGVNLFPNTQGDLSSINKQQSTALPPIKIWLAKKSQYLILKGRIGSLLDIEQFPTDQYSEFKVHMKGLTSVYSDFSLVSLSIFIQGLTNIYPVIENTISPMIDSIPFDLDLFWKYMLPNNFCSKSHSTLKCIPVTLSNGEVKYTSLNYPKLLHPFKDLDGFEGISIIQTILYKLGYVFVSNLPTYTKSLKYSNNCEVLLKSLSYSDISQLNGDERNSLRNYFISTPYFELSKLSNKSLEKKLIPFHLPIFQVSSKNTHSNINEKSICTTDWEGLKELSRFLVNHDITIIDQEWKTHCLLPSKHQSKEKIYGTIFIPNIHLFPKEYQNQIVLFVIENYNTFKPFKSMKVMKWVPTRSPGQFSSITTLYLHTDEKVNKLIEYLPNGSSMLIANEFVSHASQLQALGVNFNSIPPNFLVDIANQISTLQNPGECLELLFYCISKFKFNIELVKDIRFIPILKNSFGGFLGKSDENPKYQFSSPSQCYPLNSKFLFFTNSFISSIPLPNEFNKFHQLETPQSVIHHFGQILKQYSSNDVDIDINILEIEILPTIYLYLQSQKQLALLTKFPNPIWAGSTFGFVNPNNIILDQKKSYEPYFFTISPKISVFLKELNLKTNLTKKDCLHILREINTKSNQQEVLEKDIDLIVNVISELHHQKSLKEYELTPEEKNSLFLPSNKNLLVKYSKLIISTDFTLPEKYEKFSILNQKFSVELSKFLGIPDVKQKINKGQSFGKEFGQKEDLCQRINGIIRDYQSETFLKEIIQNSQDAGADTVFLMLDWRSYLLNHNNIDLDLYGEKFNDYLHASLVYGNNKEMSKKDIENIQTLGSSYKSSDSSKIGQYGIGVNSIYNFTDVPSIIAKKGLYIFDPMRNHFSCEDRPGRKYHFSDKEQLKDVFLPINYPNFGLNLNETFQNTLFRLPFRQSPSEISHQTWPTFKIRDIFKKFQEMAQNSLLFNPMIKKIVFYEWEPNETQPKQVFGVESTCYIPNTKTLYQKLTSNTFEQSDHFYKIDIQETGTKMNKSKSKWLVGMRVGSNHQDLNKICLNSSRGKSVSKNPSGGVAICLTEEIKGYSFCFLPLPKPTGLPVHIHGSFDLISSRQDLVVTEGSNNIDFYKDKMKLSLENTTSNEVRSYWNFLIQTELITPIYHQVLDIAKNDFKVNQIGKFYQLFPIKESTAWNIITESFYKDIQLKKLFCRVSQDFSTLSSFSESNEMVVWDLIDKKNTYVINDFKKNDIDDIVYFLLLDKCKILYIPTKIKSDSLVSLLPNSVKDFYKMELGKSFHIKDSPKESLKDKEYIIELLRYVSHLDLEGLPLALMENETTLHVFQKKKDSYKEKEAIPNPFALNFNQDFYNLYPKANEFLHRDICKLFEKENHQLKHGIKNPQYPEFFFQNLHGYLLTFKDFNDQIKEIYKSLFDNLKLFNQSQMKELKIINLIPSFDSNNSIIEFCPVSKFYNPSCNAIKRFVDIIPEFFVGWIEQLELMGLRKSLLPETFIELCTKISSSYQTLLQNESELKKRNMDFIDFGRFLMNYLFSVISSSDQKSILPKIKDLYVVPCKSIDPMFIGAISSQTLSTFSKSTIEDNINILFTTHLIRENKDWTFETSINRRFIYTNFVNISQNISNWVDSFPNLIAILILHFDQLIDFTVVSIPNLYLPIPNSKNSILISDLYILPELEFTRLEPYFNTLPEVFKKYSPLLKRLGCKELNNSLIHQSYKRFLGKKVENIKLVNKLISTYSNTTINKKEGDNNNIEEIGYDKDLIFRKASDLYFNIEDELKSRIKIDDILFEANDEINLKSILKLTDHIKEEIDLEKTIFFDDKVPKIKKLLQNPNIQQKLKHYSRDSDIQYLDLLDSIQYKLCELKTKFILLSKRINVTLNSNGSKSLYDTNKNILYIDHQYQDKTIKFIRKLELVPNMIIDILKSQNPQELKIKLNNNPFQIYQSGENVYYKRGKGDKVMALIIEELDDFALSELKFYYVMIKGQEKCQLVSSTVLYKLEGQGNENKPDSITFVQLYKEIKRTLEGIELELSENRIIKFVGSNKSSIKDLLNGVPEFYEKGLTISTIKNDEKVVSSLELFSTTFKNINEIKDNDEDDEDETNNNYVPIDEASNVVKKLSSDLNYSSLFSKFGGNTSIKYSSKPDPVYSEIFYQQAIYEHSCIRLLIDNGFYAIACFLSQQSVEKALKAYHYQVGNTFEKETHSVHLLTNDISLNVDVSPLRSHYIPTRYPRLNNHGFSNTTPPYQNFDKQEAENAFNVSTNVINEIKTLLKNK